MIAKLLFRALLPVLLAVILFSAIIVGYYHHSLDRPLDFGKQTFTVDRGETLGSIAGRLQERNILQEPYTIKIRARISGIDKQIQAGEYQFPINITVRDLLDSLAQGEDQVELKTAIIEGWSFKQMRQSIEKADKLDKITSGWSDQEVMSKLGHPDLHPEGQFYPDTYYYQSGDTDLSIYVTAFNLMQEKLDAAWRNRSEGIMIGTRYEALILASIIEKETQHRPEQPTISGVFDNRLRKGMKLQTDPTVIYGLGDSYNGNITRKHLRTDTPYNTYTRYGLTPTPISLPGWQSLDAAVNPAKTDAYYFVAKGKGQHKFSRTLKEHNRAVQKYILNK
ncbi:MAG: endolytic transglycosylase MltG [Gammaproteobacteria bacterium]|nr:endolytic transglycosylase MltG [Gammaproteobacteria bacterium]